MSVRKAAIHHQLIDEFLDQVCKPVKAKEMHPDIRQEITAHLEERIEELISEGMTEEEAVRMAIARMGSPEEVGRQFHQVHKPRTEWTLILLLALLIGIGLVAMLAMQTALEDNDRVSNAGFFEKKAVFGIIGLVAVAVIYFVDYRKLQAYSSYLYFIVVMVMLLAKLEGVTISGSGSWFVVGAVSINVPMTATYLFMITLAGMIRPREPKSSSFLIKIRTFIKELFVYLIPGWLYLLNPTLPAFMLYVSGLSALLLFAGKWRTWLAYIVGMAAAAGLMLLYGTGARIEYVTNRLLAYVDPASNPDANFMAARSLEAIRSAGLWGHGFGVKNDRLGYIYSDMIYTYLIYSLGWAMGLLIAFAFAALLIRAAGVVSKLSDPYGKRIVVGVITILSVQFGWNMLMCVGLLPITGISLPLIGYSTFSMVVDMAAIGVILSVYRRKDIFASRPTMQSE
ncbi:FtsW/RodA/SpoVE family cell cycle protein [Paenibacillus thailandensis]|uniref:FtsW/RodA/SpoVE family cell cycle protein n=1 Tax=Paenibacillus thailandensis TaxID=393250 RepID=A0ABW5R010_9BACL